MIVMGKNSSRKRTSFGVLFWIAAILLVAVLLMFNLPTIRSVLDRTDFVDVVFEERSGTGDADTPGQTDTQDPQPGDSPAPATPDTEPVPTIEPAPETPTSDTPTPENATDEDAAPRVDGAGEEIVLAPPERTEETGPERSMQGNLYFIRVSDDGRILAEPVRRTIRYDSGPLTKTIEALIAGPSADDLNRGLLSLVPQGTQLLSARVASGVAFLSFNEAFRFNPMGLEGLLAQLQQVVLTATQFSTVDAVQILIEGRTVDYLGGDGVYVGEPLTPQDLRS